jgi:CubicO group peptidase (beta-lactamase class C family)
VGQERAGRASRRPIFKNEQSPLPIDDHTLTLAIQSLPAHFKRPGGAVAVLKHGEVIARHAWGYANVTHRVAMTTKTVEKEFAAGRQAATW